MKEPELDQFMSPAKFYIHKDGPFPRYPNEEGPTEQGEGVRFCLKVEDGSVTLFYEDGENIPAFTDMDNIRSFVEEGVWVETKHPFGTPHEIIVELLKSYPSEVAAQAIISWMKSDSCSINDYHEIVHS